MEIALKHYVETAKGQRSRFLAFAMVSLACICVILRWTTPYMAVASIAYFFLLSGVLLHSQRKLHIIFMSSGALIDLLLVGVLEFERSAIAATLGGSLNVFQMGHIITSSCAVALYLPTMFFGLRAISGKSVRDKRETHIYLGRLAFVLRSIGFLLMFSLLEHIKR